MGRIHAHGSATASPELSEDQRLVLSFFFVTGDTIQIQREYNQMSKPFTYFEDTKKGAWCMREAFDEYKNINPNLTIEQHLARFHKHLKKKDDNIVKSWLTIWKTFCKQAEPSKAMPSCSSNSSIKVDMRRSNNHGFSFGSVNNYYDNSYKKRDDHDFVNKKINK